MLETSSYRTPSMHERGMLTMKNKITRKAILLGLALFMTVSAIGCGTQAVTTSTGAEAGKTEQSAAAKTEAPAAEKSEAAAPKEPVKITYPSYRVGVQVSSQTERTLLKEFAEKFGSEVEVVVEELPSDTAYTDKLKILVASNELPDLIDGKNGMLDLAVKSGQAVDLTDYLNADPEYKAEIGDAALNANLRNGKPYAVSMGRQLVGYFYNKELFAKAGIKPAETWDEFMMNCEKLKTAGIVPLSLMTGENAWTTNLLLASIVGTSGDAGNAFMNKQFPASYETPEMIDGLKKIQAMLKNYTTSDALGGLYANAANNFMQGKTAMIANGPWMTPDFANPEKSLPGFDKMVGVSAYPGSGMFNSYEIGYIICSKDKEHADAAFKFLKYKTGIHAQQLALESDGIFPLTDKVPISEELKQTNPLVAETASVGLKAKYNYMFFDVISQANVIDTFAKLYPELAFEKITAEEMVVKLTEAAAKNKE